MPTSTMSNPKPRRIIRRTKSTTATATNTLPPHLLNNPHLHKVISTTLPADYEFEILKTIDRIEKSQAVNVALQLPEGLLMYATCIGDILVKFSYTQITDGTKPTLCISILGDVTYGACCIDDLTAQSLNADLLVHYGHSCLVPTTHTAVPCLYVFVEIRVDVGHLVECVRLTFQEERDEASRVIMELAVMGTVQFRSAVVEAAHRFNQLNESPDREKPLIEFQAIVPQAKPLSPGEVLGCTAPSGLAELNWAEAMMSPRDRREYAKNQQEDAGPVTQDNTCAPLSAKRQRVMIFLADGRFHLEAAMIANPSLRALRYDPYSKTLTEEKYEIVKMKRLRREAVGKVRNLLGVDPSAGKQFKVENASCPTSSEDIANSLLQQHITTPNNSTINSSQTKTVGIILGTLGRQGNPGILARIRSLLHSRGVRTMIVLLSEIFPKKLEMLSWGAGGGNGGVCAWVQIACPRLSIDWGHYFCVPVLSPFELFVALGEVADSTLWSASELNEASKSQESNTDDIEGGYPMDFYSKAGGPWTNYFDSNKDRRVLSYGV